MGSIPFTNHASHEVELRRSVKTAQYSKRTPSLLQNGDQSSTACGVSDTKFQLTTCTSPTISKGATELKHSIRPKRSPPSTGGAVLMRTSTATARRSHFSRGIEACKLMVAPPST